MSARPCSCVLPITTATLPPRLPHKDPPHSVALPPKLPGNKSDLSRSVPYGRYKTGWWTSFYPGA